MWRNGELREASGLPLFGPWYLSCGVGQEPSRPTRNHGPRVGARVAPQRCPILRSGKSHDTGQARRDQQEGGSWWPQEGMQQLAGEHGSGKENPRFAPCDKSESSNARL